MVIDREAIPPQSDREAGLTVVEVVIAATILAVAIMTSGLTVLLGMRSQDESEDSALALRAVRDICAQIQEQANEAQDLSALRGIGAAYRVYDGLEEPIPGLDTGTITITIYADEPNVPISLGGAQDLNFDGDANDNLSNQSGGSDLQILPTEIVVRYTDERGTITETFHRRFTKTTE